MFRRTIVRLTIQYALLLLGLMAVFSVAIYAYMDYAFGSDYVSRVTAQLRADTPSSSQVRGQDISDAVDAGLVQLSYILVAVDGALVLIIPVISYAMAKRALAPIQASYETQQRFVDNASHEMRTPLSVIQGELELALQRDRDGRQYREAIRRSLNETRSLASLVTSLLLLARGDEPEEGTAFEPLDLETLVTGAIQQTASVWPDAPSRITVSTRGSTRVVGSSDLLTRAIGNVLDNALKYSPEGAPIEVGIDRHDHAVRLTVRDHGIGMSDDERLHAFDRFWRADASRTAPGHGLGLALVRRVIEYHHGSISLSPAPNEGTKVTIII